MHFLPFYTIKTLTLRMDHGKLLDVLTSLPVSQSILPRAVCFATSRPTNHAICSFIDSSGYASGPIRRCLFIDYIIRTIIEHEEDIMVLNNVTKFHKILIKNIRVRERMSFKTVNFHKQRVITLESLMRYWPLPNLKKTSWY